MAVLKYKDPQRGFVAVPALMGPPGESINSITQTSNTEPSAKNIITITTTDGKTYPFNYYNGHGIKEVKQITAPTEGSGINTYRFIYSDSDNHYEDMTVRNGIGISSIEQTVVAQNSNEENTVLITLSNGTTSTIKIKNGLAGGIDEIRQGAPGYIEYTSPNTGTSVSVPVGAPAKEDTTSTKICVLGVLANDHSELKYNTNVYVNCADGVLVGAAWNDYAECRATTDVIESGRVVYENGDDTLSQSTERMTPACYIVSDTYGFVIGETAQSKTPLAMAGRVLAYPYENREEYKPGDAVCSGPNGTVSKMTTEEKVMHPECIIGYVSCVPSYEIWGEKNIQVNGRIWIKVI